MADPVDKKGTVPDLNAPSSWPGPRSTAGFSPGVVTPAGYSYLNRAPSLVTSTRRGPVRAMTETPLSPGSSYAPRASRLPASCNQHRPSDSVSSPPRRLQAPAFPRSNTTPNLYSTHVASSAAGMQAPLAAHSLADLPRDPRTWLPTEVSIYLFHVFANVPVPVMKTLAHFVASAHLTGKAFLRLRERDLEQKGMNTRWRRLLCEASRRLRRDALRRRIWTGREDEWSGSDDGASDPPRTAEQAREGSQLAHGEKRVMTITLKRIQNRMYVKDAIQGLEPSVAQETQSPAPQTKPRRKETASWAHADAEAYTPSRGLVSPPFGEGCVRGRVTSLTSQTHSGRGTTGHGGGKDAFSQSYTVDSAIGAMNDLHEAPSEISNASNGAERTDKETDVWSAPATAPFLPADEDRASIAEAEGERDDISPWSPLEQGLIDAILEADLSRSEEGDMFDISKASVTSSASLLADDVDYDPVKPIRSPTSKSEGNRWQADGAEDDKLFVCETKREEEAGDYFAVADYGNVPRESIEGQKDTSSQTALRDTDIAGEEIHSDEDRYQDSPEDESVSEPTPSPTGGRQSPSNVSYFHARTLSKASTRSTRSFLSAHDGVSSATIRSDSTFAPRHSVSVRSAPRRKGVASVATLFGLGIVEAEPESPGEMQEEPTAVDETPPSDIAELINAAVLEVESDEEEEEGRFDDPAEETDYKFSADTNERSTSGDSQGTSNSQYDPSHPSSPDASPPRPESEPAASDAPSPWQMLLRSTLDQLHYVRGCMGLRALPAYAVALGVGAVVVIGSAAMKEVVGRRGPRG